MSLPGIVLIASKSKKNTSEKLKKGYREMAQINLAIANMCINADNDQLAVYEEKLAESE